MMEDIVLFSAIYHMRGLIWSWDDLDFWYRRTKKKSERRGSKRSSRTYKEKLNYWRLGNGTHSEINHQSDEPPRLATICKHRVSLRMAGLTRLMTRKLKEKCLERRVIGDRCDRYGRSGVRGIRSGKAKPTKLGSAWTTRRVPPKVPAGKYHRTWRKPRLWLLQNSFKVSKQKQFWITYPST